MLTSNDEATGKFVWESIFNDDADRQNAAFVEFYHTDATFTDPLVSVTSRNNIKAQFNALTLVTVKSAQTNVFTSDSHVMVDGIVNFAVLRGKLSIDLRVLTKFHFKGGRIIHQEDIWSLRDLLVSIPILGSFYGVCTRYFGSLSSSLITASMRKEVE